MTNQASEDIRNHISRRICHEAYGSEYEELTSVAKWTHNELVDEIIMPAINALIRTEKLKLLDEVVHQSTINLKSAKAVAGWAELRKEQLEAEL